MDYVIALPFSGTRYAAEYLTKCGLNAKHECRFWLDDVRTDPQARTHDVEVSWSTAGHALPMFDPDARKVHIVREPIAVFRSLMSGRTDPRWAAFVMDVAEGPWQLQRIGDNDLAFSGRDVALMMDRWDHRCRLVAEVTLPTERMDLVAEHFGVDFPQTPYDGTHTKPHKFDHVTLDNLDAEFGDWVSNRIWDHQERWAKMCADLA